MTDLATIKQVAQITQDAEGHEVVQIPRALWDEFIEHLEPRKPSQHEQILALFEDWKQHPEDDASPEWWEEFDRFLRENRFHIPDRNLDFGDEE